MARTLLTPVAKGVMPTPAVLGGNAAADITNFNAFNASGNDLVIANNTAAAVATVTVNSTAGGHLRRTGDITAFSIPANGLAVIGPLLPDGWQQTDGNIYLAASAVTVKLSVIQL